MKKIFFLFLTVAMFSSGYSQKNYSFDCMLVYSFKFNDASKVEEVVFYTNSKDNGYFLRAFRKDSLQYSVRFVVHDKVSSKVVFSKNEFNSAKIILDCKFITRQGYAFKYQTDNYEFINKKYALMEG